MKATQFDRFITSVLEGLGNMGTGGMANRGGANTQPQKPTTSTNAAKPMTGGVQMKHSTGAANPMQKNAQNPNQIDLNAIDPSQHEALINSALETNNNEQVGSFIQQKLQSNPGYFQTPEFQKNQGLQKWSQDKNNQALIAQMAMGGQTK